MIIKEVPEQNYFNHQLRDMRRLIAAIEILAIALIGKKEFEALVQERYPRD